MLTGKSSSVFEAASKVGEVNTLIFLWREVHASVWVLCTAHPWALLGQQQWAEMPVEFT